MSEASESSSSSSRGDFEIRVLGVGNASEHDDTQSASASDVEREEPVKASGADRAINKCVSCSNRKVKTCSNQACKRCCVRLEAECPAHNKTPEPMVKTSVASVDVIIQPLRKARKAVLKNEFKEANFMYYDETVTLFCVRDFFHAKKLSQPLLNDQTRSLRASSAAPASASTKAKPVMTRRSGSLETKAKVIGALRSGTKRRKVEA